jgi:hypothetical protein
MKAHFRFIDNNKMKTDFCFIESAKWCRARLPLQSTGQAFFHAGPLAHFVFTRWTDGLTQPCRTDRFRSFPACG